VIDQFLADIISTPFLNPKRIRPMGQRMLTIYTDDRDGSDLDGEPESVYLAFRDQSWNLTLSERNLRELEKVVRDFTKHADARRGKGQGPKLPRNKHGVPVATVRHWAQNEGKKFIEAAGLSVPGQRGRVDAKIHDLHDKHS
jgi:hypothetical protein